MARTINEMARDRRRAVAALKRELKGVRTSVERSIRRIDRLLQRRNKVPEISDLDLLTVEYQEAQKQFDEYQTSIGDALRLFVLV